MLPSGKMADLFGMKPQLVGGLLFLATAALITGFMKNSLAVNVLCGFIGLGTAMICPPAIGTLFATYPESRRRNRVTGALGAGT